MDYCQSDFDYKLCRSSMFSNCLVFHTSGGISSSPVAFLFLIFLSTKSSSSRVNGSCLMSNCLLIILVMKGCILPFPKKGDLGLAKNYRGITLTSIAAKIYNALLRNRIEPKIDNILRKNQNDFRRNRSTTSQILTIRRILEGVRAKNLQSTILFIDFTKAFDSIHRGKMEQILLAYSIPNGWKHRLFRHCSRSTERGHTSSIPLYHLSRLSG